MKSNKAFVAFIDILGYSDFIKVFSAEDYADIITKSLSIADGLENMNDVLLKNISKYMSVNLLSDSMIIVLDMNLIPIVKKIFNKSKVVLKNNSERMAKNIITTVYFSILSNVVVEFIARTGFLLRGAVDYGDFQIMNIRNKRDKLIYSQALVRAYELEKSVDLPRIMISEAALNEIGKLSKASQLPSYIVKDYDGMDMLDLYKGLKSSHWKRAGRMLDDIKKLINLRSPHASDYKKHRKYAWFKNFHNSKVVELNRDKPDLRVNELKFA